MVEWNRLADATAQSAAQQLSIVTVGHVHTNDFDPLTTRFQRLEQVVLESDDRAHLNRAIDAAANDWILILREREIVSDALADEIRGVLHEGRARGFRIRSIVLYAGKPLRIGDGEGEIRLFHRRYYMRFAKAFAIQGTVVRLSEPLRSMSFESSEAHRAQLAKSGIPHSSLRQLLLFLRYAAEARTLDRNTLRYLWIEAGFDQAVA